MMEVAIRTREGISWSWRQFGSKFLLFGLVPFIVLYVIFSIVFNNELGNSVVLYEGQNWGEIAKLSGHRDYVIFSEFSPDSQYFLTVSKDNMVQVRDSHRGAIISTLKGDNDGISSAEFSADGQFVLTRGDSDVRLWA